MVALGAHNVCFTVQEFCGVGPARLRLVYQGRKLEDTETPGELELENETMVHVVVQEVRDLVVPVCVPPHLLQLLLSCR